MVRAARLSFILLLLSLLVAPCFAANSRRSASYFLNENLSDLKFTNVTFAEAIDYLRDVSGANIMVDWKTLEAVNVDQESLINVHLRNVSLRKALTLVLAEAGNGTALTFFWDENVLTITTQAQADTIMYTVVYPVKDLLVSLPNLTVDTADQGFLNNSSSSNTITPGSGGGGSGSQLTFNSSVGSGSNGDSNQTMDQKGQALVQLVETVVRPEVWKDNGGTATITFWQGDLIVHAPISVLEAIGGPLD